MTAGDETRALEAFERMAEALLSTAGHVVMDMGDTEVAQMGRRRAEEDIVAVRELLERRKAMPPALWERTYAARWLSSEGVPLQVTDRGADLTSLVALTRRYPDAELVESWSTPWVSVDADVELARGLNFTKAAELIAEIEATLAVQRHLKAAFQRAELDGGWKAAKDHPLYQQAQAELERLYEQLRMVF